MEEQEKCSWCGRGKFDPPRKKCAEPGFHWLLAGREWTLNEDNQWVPTETKAHREESFDGLLKPQQGEIKYVYELDMDKVTAAFAEARDMMKKEEPF